MEGAAWHSPAHLPPNPSAHHRHVRPGLPERGQLLPERPQAGQVPLPATLQRGEVPNQPVLRLLPKRGAVHRFPIR